MSTLPRPNQKILEDVFSGKKPTLYKKLKTAIQDDLQRPKKKGHWIWYMYPQSKAAVAGTRAHYEYTSEDIFNAIFFEDLYQNLFRNVNAKPLSWFPEIDHMRVLMFREKNASLIEIAPPSPGGSFTDMAAGFK